MARCSAYVSPEPKSQIHICISLTRPRTTTSSRSMMSSPGHPVSVQKMAPPGLWAGSPQRRTRPSSITISARSGRLCGGCHEAAASCSPSGRTSIPSPRSARSRTCPADSRAQSEAGAMMSASTRARTGTGTCC